LSSVAAATMEETPAASMRAGAARSRSEPLLARFHQVRNFTNALSHGLAPEDCVVQSMPDVSPTKWHLAHTTWFFETFILKKWVTGFRPVNPQYAFLFNSYYNAAGDMHRRDLRGLISRPTVDETQEYRCAIDEEIESLIASADENLLSEIEPLLILGIHHEQQHQELLVTDIKHVLAQNPLHPVFRARPPGALADGWASGPCQFIEFDEAIIDIGHDGNGFAYDNESPRHRALVLPFSLASRPVTNGEYIAFIEDNGYARPEFWLSLGWMTVNEQRWPAPLYWMKRDGEWWNYTLSGFRPVDPNEPVTHVSYFEADAFANWSGARLPTEFEWERAVANIDIDGNFVETEAFHPLPSLPRSARASLPAGESGGRRADVAMQPSPTGRGGHRPRVTWESGREAVGEAPGQGNLQQMFGDVWEWTRSSYSPYPGYRAAPGALGEYNGKFMCNQYVLRGGSCATSRTHIRRTYRNFFQPEKRWQFTGIRLARDPQ
jgi:ergothioneine biosynthesis protein EgtB